MQLQELITTQIYPGVQAATAGKNQSLEKQGGQSSFAAILQLLGTFSEDAKVEEKQNKALETLEVNNFILANQELFNQIVRDNLSQEQIQTLIDNTDVLTSGDLVQLKDQTGTLELPATNPEVSLSGNSQLQGLLITKLNFIANKINNNPTNLNKVNDQENQANNLSLELKSLSKEIPDKVVEKEETKNTNAKFINHNNMFRLTATPELNKKTFTNVVSEQEKSLEKPQFFLARESKETTEFTDTKIFLKDGQVKPQGFNSDLQQQNNFSNQGNLEMPNQNQTLNSQAGDLKSFQGLLEQVSSGNSTTNNNEPTIPIKEIPEYLLKQISNKVQVNSKVDGSSEMNIKLKPDELGKLTLKLTAHEGQVSVKIFTDNNHARSMVEQNLVQLRQSLNNQGIKCNSIDVQVGSDSNLQHFFGQQSNPFTQSKYTGKIKFSGRLKEDDEYFLNGVDSIEKSQSSSKLNSGNVEFLA